MPIAPPPQPISLNTAAILTGRSLRTWQRRIEEGLVPRLGDGRALVPFDAVAPELPLSLTAEDVDMLVRLRRLGRARGQKLVRLRGVKTITSSRKFDRHGDWH